MNLLPDAVQGASVQPETGAQGSEVPGSGVASDLAGPAAEAINYRNLDKEGWAG